MSTVSKLFEACQKGDLQTLTNLLKPFGELAALIYAAMFGHLDVVMYLIHGNADIDAIDDHGRTASVYATMHSHTTVVNIINQSKVDITGLIVEDVIRAGNLRTFRPFLSKLSHIDERTTQGWTMLMRVCMYDYVDLVDAVLNLGAAIDGREIFGTTSLMFAARQGNLDVAKYLIQRGAVVNLQNDYGATALMFAAETGEVLMAEMLLRNGADLHLRTTIGETALMRAYAHEKSSFVALLLIDNGGHLDDLVDVDEYSTKHDIVLELFRRKELTQKKRRQDEYIKNIFVACKLSNKAGGGLEYLKEIIADWLDPEEERSSTTLLDDDGSTPLIAAVLSNQQDIVDFLLHSNCRLDIDLNAQDRLGWTAVMYCCKLGRITMLRSLLSKSADLKVTSYDGSTAESVTEDLKISRLLAFHAGLHRRH